MGIIGDGHFHYLPDPNDPKAKLALALYREGLSVNLMPYQFLGFFKVINILRDKGKDQQQWIREYLQHVTDKDALTRIAAIRTNGTDVAEYLYGSGRCAVAHAFDQNNVVNPDDPADLIRLAEDLPVIRELARLAIEREFGVKSKRDFHDHPLRAP
jgi:methylamine utilization protein MauJ